MKILILGSGAMGCLFASKLKQNDVDVTVFNRSNKHVTAIQKHGLKVLDKHEKSTIVKIPIVTDLADLQENYDLVLVLVKAFATESVLEKVLPAIPETTPILTLQNGVGNREKIKCLAPAHDVFVGGTWSGASVQEAGVIVHQAWGRTFIGSEQLEKYRSLFHSLAGVFSTSGLATEVSANVESIIWSKLIVNIAYNGLTAVTRLKNGDVIDSEEGKDLMTHLVGEAVQIAEVKGIPLLYNDPIKECIRLGQEEIGLNTSSMLADVLLKRKTEIEVINGAIVEEGKKYQLPTPYNDMICQLIKIIETSYSRRLDE